MLTLYLVFMFGVGFAASDDNRFMGCYKDIPSPRTFTIRQYTTVDQCIGECKTRYYRYAMIRSGGFCICNNYLGEEVNSTMTCGDYCNPCDLRANLTDTYSTGNLVPGPPRNVLIKRVTDTSLHMSWDEPESYTEISSYQINAMVLHTFSNFAPISPVLTYSNDTRTTELSSLQPATKYNVTLAAVSPDGLGAIFSQIIETKVGVPDNVPDRPKVVKTERSKMEIQINPTLNNNGPVTSYLVVVLNHDSKQVFQEELLKAFNDAKRDGIHYYIAAELNPQEVTRHFVVGDGRNYGRYYNAPLNPNTNYNIIVGVTSQFNGQVRKAYSRLDDSHKEVLVLGKDYEENGGDSPAVVIGLSIAIGLLSFMLVAGIIGFIILKSRVTNRRQRLSDNQELTLQGPMIEVENNGYIPEEEHSKANHYKNLKQKLRTIHYNQLKVEPTNLLGIGRFGRVNSGSIYENNTLIPVAAYSIADKKLSPEDKRSMLCDLDLLIRTGKHDNIVSLIGTCETSQMLFVILEYVSMNLKDLLLGSRDSLPGRFSNMTEEQALDIAISIAEGMAHLESNKIVHKQLCARSIMIANGFIPKISAYGLAQYHSHNNLPDYTRWTALEVFKAQPHNAKSDVWSYACLLWEICVLGGTPYGNFSNNEIPERVTKGLRLPQIQYFSDDLYQIMLNCWQIDMDERPYFSTLIESLKSLKDNTLVPYLNFNLYSSFQYEQFYPDMEIAVRPVF